MFFSVTFSKAKWPSTRSSEMVTAGITCYIHICFLDLVASEGSSWFIRMFSRTQKWNTFRPFQRSYNQLQPGGTSTSSTPGAVAVATARSCKGAPWPRQWRTDVIFQTGRGGWSRWVALLFHRWSFAFNKNTKLSPKISWEFEATSPLMPSS